MMRSTLPLSVILALAVLSGTVVAPPPPVVWDYELHYALDNSTQHVQFFVEGVFASRPVCDSWSVSDLGTVPASEGSSFQRYAVSLASGIIEQTIQEGSLRSKMRLSCGAGLTIELVPPAAPEYHEFSTAEGYCDPAVADHHVSQVVYLNGSSSAGYLAPFTSPSAQYGQHLYDQTTCIGVKVGSTNSQVPFTGFVSSGFANGFQTFDSICSPYFLGGAQIGDEPACAPQNVQPVFSSAQHVPPYYWSADAHSLAGTYYGVGSYRAWWINWCAPRTC